MAVDSDEEVDYSKMDQVREWLGPLGSYTLAHLPFPTLTYFLGPTHL